MKTENLDGKPVLRIVELATVDSTNSYVRRHVEELSSPTWVTAHEQNAGRGQRSNVWSMYPGDLAASLYVEFDPPVPATRFFHITQCAALAPVLLLHELGLRAQIKWSNDILLNGRKIAGILVENTIRDSSITGSIIGIGFNQTPDHQSSNRHYRWPGGTLFNNLTGNQINDFDQRLPYRMLQLIDLLLAGHHGEIHALYLKHLYARGKNCVFKRTGPGAASFEAILTGVRPTGELELLPNDGIPIQLLFGDVQLLPPVR